MYLEAFMATELNTVFLGWQLHHVVQTHQYFWHQFSLHHQGSDVTLCSALCTLTPLAQVSDMTLCSALCTLTPLAYDLLWWCLCIMM